MILAKEVLQELKSVIGYYRYEYLKSNEYLVKVFKVRWDNETIEVYTNKLEEICCDKQNTTPLLLGLKNKFFNDSNLIVAVVINRNGKIVVDANESLMIIHNMPSNIDKNLIREKSMEVMNIDATGCRPDIVDVKPYFSTWKRK